MGVITGVIGILAGFLSLWAMDRLHIDDETSLIILIAVVMWIAFAIAWGRWK
jgi:hypothetical protein